MTKTALVTGCAGFIGRHMVRELKSRGYTVDCCDIRNDPLYWHDANDVFRYIEHRYDLVVHAAYHVGGREGIDGINMNFAKNLQLDSSLFEWAIRTGQKRVLYFSSCAAYPWYYQGAGVASALQEDMIDLDMWPVAYDYPPAPFDNYGWAKLMGERLAKDARANGVPVTVVRPFSGYGEDQSAEYPFPAIVARAVRGDLSVWGPPGQTRDWIHVSDVISGALAVIESGTTDPVNLCTGVATEMGELAKLVWGIDHNDDAGNFVVNYDDTKPTGAFYRVGDPARMLNYYTPKVSIDEGIRRALQ